MRPHYSRLLGSFVVALVGSTLALGSVPAGAAQPTVDLGNAGSFAVLAGSEVTNTGSSVINGNLGVSPGTAITGFPPGIVHGTIHSADATAARAQTDTTTAYNDADGRTPFNAVATELGGRTLKPGVYQNATLGVTGTLTLDAEGDSNAVFVFQADSTLITASSSRVEVINGAQACNVFWQVGSSATLGTTTQFVGTVLALTSITADNGATVHGRLLARNGAVTLNNNTITRSTCATPVTTTTTSTTSTTTTSTTSTTTPVTSTTALASTPTTEVPAAGTAAPTAGSPTDTGTAVPTAGGPATPTGGVTGGESGRSTPPGITGGGDTPTLPRTGASFVLLTLAGTLAVFLGATMLRRSATVRAR